MVTHNQDWRKANIRMALSLTLGWAGADRFYNGQIGWGIIKAATFGGLLMWWLADILYYSYRAGQAEPSRGWWWQHLRMALSVTFGFFGVDRAYSGQVGWAVLKLITLGGLGAWWIADAAYYSYQSGRAQAA